MVTVIMRILAIFFLIIVYSCSGSPDFDSSASSFKQAKKSFSDGKYTRAKSEFEYLILNDPLSKYAADSYFYIAESKYHLYENFRKKNLAPDTVYIVDNIGHLRHLKHIFKNENIGFFYRDDIWAMVINEKERMNDNDKEIFNEIKLKSLVINKKRNLNFKDADSYYGFGWSHNMGKPGIWSEGPISTLLFRTEENYGDIKLEIFCRPYITKKNSSFEFDIYVNNSLNKNIKLTNNNQDEKIEILIKEKLIKNNEIKIDFNFKNLVSPDEVLESPDSRKLGILMKNIKIIPKTT